MLNKILWVLSSLFFTINTLSSQKMDVISVQNIPNASFRGLSVVDDKTAWLSGTKGTFGKTVDGGVHWDFNSIKGFEKYDFRSLYAFDSLNAIAANAGSPAYILRTKDGGKNWNIVYQNDNKDAFFDGISFWNNTEGVIYGDPINGRMLMLKTQDSGFTWQEITTSPVMSEGEASFAASGTTIRCYAKSKLIIATGGNVSRLWISDDKGATWTTQNVPILQGISTQGIFSFAFNGSEGIAVGGDYKQDTLQLKHIFITHNNGKTWLMPSKPTRGYRECVEYINAKMLVSVGPTGMDISHDAGRTCKGLSDEKGYHTVRKSRVGKLIITAGNGKVSILKY